MKNSCKSKDNKKAFQWKANRQPIKWTSLNRSGGGVAESSQVKFEHVQLGGVPKSQNERGSQVNKFEHVGRGGGGPHMVGVVMVPVYHVH